MDKKVYSSTTSRQTREIGKKLAKQSVPMAKDKPVVILLYGQLGAGKTTLVKGLGQELGIVDITSPTFIIIDEYDIKESNVKKLFHIDLYRVSNDQEFSNLEIVKNLKPHTITCIEWSENIEPIMDEIIKRATVIKVHIRHVEKNTREIEITN